MIQIPIMLIASSAEFPTPSATNDGHTLTDLLGVSYRYQLYHTDSELPLELAELWLYIRFILSNNAMSKLRRRLVKPDIGLKIIAMDHPLGRQIIRYDTEAEGEPFILGELPFRRHVVSKLYKLSGLAFPCLGRYEFRLMLRSNRQRWDGNSWKIIAKTHIEVR